MQTERNRRTSTRERRNLEIVSKSSSGRSVQLVILKKSGEESNSTLAGGLQWVSETDNLIIALVLTCCPLTQQRMIGVGAWWVYCPYWPR